jgi:hypothetical protein
MVVDFTEYRLRRQLRSACASSAAVVVLTWRRVSPSAHLMVDPRNGARAVIRDTRSYAGRYLWSVLGAGEMGPVSEGRTDDLEQARSIAEAALRGYGDALGRGPASGSDHPFVCFGP